MKKNIIDVAVVTLFNPTEDVLDNIRSYLPYIKELLIIDNSNTTSSIVSTLKKEFSSIVLLSSSVNLGISKSLNLAISYSKRKNYNWLLTMDQDSYFPPSEIDKFLTLFSQLSKDNLAIFSPLHNKKFLKEEFPHNSKELFVLTSANIINIEKVVSMGGFDENLFIDEVDHDFCLRLKKLNYIIIQNYNCYIHHTLGKKHSKLNINLYSSERIYYMIRNYLYIKKKYKREVPSFFRERDTYLLKFFFKQFIYSNHRGRYIKMFYKGIQDYRNSNMGYRIKL